jgi:glutamate racemase
MGNRPIGVYDSGVGGLSLLRELRSLLPNENFIYISDNAFAPYGALSPEDIRKRSQALTQWLCEQSCKLIVVACNTATTNAIESLRKTYQIPFVGIEPAIKPAALQTKTGVVGVLATKGTLSSGLFHETSTAYGQGVRILEKEGKHLVEMIESGILQSEEMNQLLQSYTQPMIEQGADHLVLGCTHYPFLAPILNQTLPKHIKIVDCNDAVAKQVKRVLNKTDLGCESQHLGNTTYYCTGDSQTMRQFVSPNDVSVLSIS